VIAWYASTLMNVQPYTCTNNYCFF